MRLESGLLQADGESRPLIGWWLLGRGLLIGGGAECWKVVVTVTLHRG